MSTWFILWSLEIFYGHWKYFMAIWYILRSFGIFSLFLHFVPRKIWQPWSKTKFTEESKKKTGQF
jgi:hypothetical protein